MSGELPSQPVKPTMPPDNQEEWDNPLNSVRTPAVSWFPPHMHRAHKRLAEEIKQVDVVLEMRDARLPLVTGNTGLDRLIHNRKRVILFNKSSLADPAVSAVWRGYFQSGGLTVLFLDADSGKGINLIYPLVNELVADSRAHLKKRGIRPPMSRLLVAGIPNVGKSTLINRMARRKRLETAPTPGVTKAVEWVNLRDRYMLMDTPGLILPRLEQSGETFKMGWIGAFKDSILGEEKLGTTLLEYLLKNHPQGLAEHYKIEIAPGAGSHSILEQIGLKRGHLRPGGTFDPVITAAHLLTDFRNGKLGRITLESPATGT